MDGMPVVSRRRTPAGYAIALLVAVALLPAAQPAAAFSLRDLWPFGKKEAPVPDPTPYRVDFQVDGDDAKLAKELRKASGLVADQKVPPSGLVGLLGRARQDISNLTAVLYRNARYSGEVFISIDGHELHDVSPFAPIDTRPVPVTVTVRPGPPFVFGEVSAYPLPPGKTLADYGLIPGEPANSAKILAAETALANDWRKLGHPLVKIGQRDAIADHQARELDVTLAVQPGPVADFGRVQVSGTVDVDPTLVLRRAGIDGGLYSPVVTDRAARRLRDLGVFDSVRVSVADELAPNGTIPVEITVTERKKRVIGVSANYSSTEGGGLEVYWMHRNLFGGAEQLRLSAEVSRVFDSAFDDPDFRVAARFQKPAVLDAMTDLTLRTEVYRETTDAYRVTAAEAEAGLVREFSDILSGGIAFAVQRSQTRDSTGVESDHLLTTLTGHLDWDTTDNRLDPTKGLRANVLAAPSYDFLQNQFFTTFKTGFSAYKSVDADSRLVLAGRVQVGTLTVGDITDVAPDKRFYVGGGGSVRGYAYQNIGPRDQDGDLIGGRSFVELSGEVRYRVSDAFGVVAFVDAGNAYSGMLPTFGDLKVGVGGGVRYLTPVGPLRLDAAVPLQPGPGDPSFAIYVGLGQAF